MPCRSSYPAPAWRSREADGNAIHMAADVIAFVLIALLTTVMLYGVFTEGRR
jgi:hypothetical protein